MLKIIPVLLLLASVAAAQEYNVPFNPPAGAGGGGGLLYSQNFNEANDAPTDTTGTVDDDCTASPCPLSGAQSLSVGPNAPTFDRWWKDNIFTNRQSGCVKFDLHEAVEPVITPSSVFFLRVDGNDTSTYALKVPIFGGDGKWVVFCNDDPGTSGGTIAASTTYNVVLDIDMANGDMDLYVDGASSPTVACDGSADPTGYYDGIKFLANTDTSHFIIDDVVMCDNNVTAGVCSCT